MTLFSRYRPDQPLASTGRTQVRALAAELSATITLPAPATDEAWMTLHNQLAAVTTLLRQAPTFISNPGPDERSLSVSVEIGVAGGGGKLVTLEGLNRIVDHYKQALAERLTQVRPEATLTWAGIDLRPVIA